MSETNAGQKPGESPKDPFPMPACPPRPPKQTPSDPVNVPPRAPHVIFPDNEPLGVRGRRTYSQYRNQSRYLVTTSAAGPNAGRSPRTSRVPIEAAYLKQDRGDLERKPAFDSEAPPFVRPFFEHKREHPFLDRVSLYAIVRAQRPAPSMRMTDSRLVA
jgi:hypothetical protein